MRTAKPTTLLIFTLLFYGLAKAWQLPSFQVPLISWIGGTSSPDIPQFILDTEHPWLTAHAGELANLPNATAILCTPIEIPPQGEVVEDVTKTQLQGLDVPESLFHNLEINNDRVGNSRDGWTDLRDRLTEMKSCPRALAEVRALTVDVFIYNDELTNRPAREPTLPPAHLPALTAEVLGEMKNLRRLEWKIDGPAKNAAFADAFAKAGTRLHSIEELTAGTDAAWLIDACPSVATLLCRRSREYRLSLTEAYIEAAGLLKRLRKLDLGGLHHWTQEMADREYSDFSPEDRVCPGNQSSNC